MQMTLILNTFGGHLMVQFKKDNGWLNGRRVFLLFLRRKLMDINIFACTRKKAKMKAIFQISNHIFKKMKN